MTSPAAPSAVSNAAPLDAARRVPVFVRAVTLITAIIFTLAVVGKITQPNLFIDIIERFLYAGAQPRPLATVTGLAVIAVESALVVLLLFKPGSKRVLGITTLVLVAFTLFILSLLRDPPGTGCGCLGPTLPVRDPQRSLLFALIRNAAFITLLVQAWRALPREPRMDGLGESLYTTKPGPRVASNPEQDSPRPPRAPGSSDASRPGSRRDLGFSIIELIVSISIVTVLVSLSIPSLAGARRSANDLVKLSDLRAATALATAYTTDHHDLLPYMATRGQEFAPISIRGHAVSTTGDYFGAQRGYWMSTLNDASLMDFAQVSPLEDIEYPTLRAQEAARRDDAVFRSSFLLTHAAFAAPEYFAQKSQPHSDSPMLRPVRISEAVTPSLKGLIVHARSRLPGLNTPESDWAIHTGFTDGSARHLKPTYEQIIEYLKSFEGYPRLYTLPGLTTRNGIAGRDVNLPTDATLAYASASN